MNTSIFVEEVFFEITMHLESLLNILSLILRQLISYYETSHGGTIEDYRKDLDNIATECLKTSGAICLITMDKVSSKVINCNLPISERNWE